jgi:hypothetical protein
VTGADGAPVYAAFVSPHGFGHAARASAVLGALRERTGARFHLFATTPRWFFDETISGAYTLHQVVTDVGLRQRSALEFDLEATVEALDRFLPFEEELVEELAARVHDAGARAVLCDISPLGIAVAERAGLPSLLVENFTWPWLYEPLVARAPRLAHHAEALEGWIRRATARVQTEPLCRRVPETDTVVPPIGRRARTPRARVREDLGVGRESPLVVLTMGGISEPLPFLERLKKLPEVHFLVTGADGSRREGNLHLFDNGTRIYLPDFIRAADAVVAKLGYSTVAEVWNEGAPLAFVTRGDFRETGPVRRWVEENLRGFEIPGRDFPSGEWIGRIPDLLEMAGARGEDGRGRVGPADEVARRLQALAGSGGSATPPAPPG